VQVQWRDNKAKETVETVKTKGDDVAKKGQAQYEDVKVRFVCLFHILRWEF
jgi:hypothetical protein